jgi:RNA polymerase sigma factor (sigma-70 family)
VWLLISVLRRAGFEVGFSEVAIVDMGDLAAVSAVRAGDVERCRELVERHERRVFAVAWSRLGDAALAEEATQAASIRGYRRLWLLGDSAKFAGWITSIARNTAINLGLRHRRELNKRERWSLEQTTPAVTSPSESAAPCTPEMLRQTLEELPAAHCEGLIAGNCFLPRPPVHCALACTQRCAGETGCCSLRGAAPGAGVA